MKPDEPLYPIHIGPLGRERPMPHPKLGPKLVQQPPTPQRRAHRLATRSAAAAPRDPRHGAHRPTPRHARPPRIDPSSRGSAPAHVEQAKPWPPATPPVNARSRPVSARSHPPAGSGRPIRARSMPLRPLARIPGRRLINNAASRSAASRIIPVLRDVWTEGRSRRRDGAHTERLHRRRISSTIGRQAAPWGRTLLTRYTAELMPLTFPQPGGCLCGKTRYQLLADPLIAYACHCTDCQTASGSGFALCLTTELSSIEVSTGEPTRRTISFPDAREWSFAVCPHCETRLWSERRATPEIVNIRAGTLDDPSWVYPVAHIWVESALDWSPISEDSITFPGQPGDPSEMIRAWRERQAR